MIGQKQKQMKVNIFLSFVFALALFCLPKISHAATIYFSPAAGSFKTGDLINVSVKVNTQEQAINNVDGTIYFPTDTLEVMSVSKSGSIFSLWVEEPSFSNGAGSISFNGGVPTPGFTGSAGKVLGIVFRAKKSGTASVSFASASIRANDGFGTNILTGSGQAQFDISGGQTEAPEEPNQPPAEEPQNKTVSSAISSNTHPDPGKWYNNSDPRFTWSLPAGTTAVRILYGENQNSQPSVVYQPAISSKALTGVEDGVWYFHLQLKNANGWGPVSHFRFQIDTTKPSDFNIQANERDLTDPIGKFILTATDASSGIDHFVIKTDNGAEQNWTGKSGETYSTSALSVGTHTLFIKAFDQAGNYLADSVSLEVKPLEAPIITDYPANLLVGDDLIIRGRAKPNSQVTVWVERDGDQAVSQLVTTDANGDFSFTLKDSLKKGVYSIWASAVAENGAQSSTSAKSTVVVKQSDATTFGTKAINLLSIVIILVALIIALALLSLFGWRKVLLFKSKLKKETRSAEDKLHKTFDTLRDDIREQIETLEKAKNRRALTAAEKRVIKKLQAALNRTELSVEKEIRDIEKI